MWTLAVDSGAETGVAAGDSGIEDFEVRTSGIAFPSSVSLLVVAAGRVADGAGVLLGTWEDGGAVSLEETRVGIEGNRIEEDGLWTRIALIGVVGSPELLLGVCAMGVLA